MTLLRPVYAQLPVSSHFIWGIRLAVPTQSRPCCESDRRPDPTPIHPAGIPKEPRRRTLERPTGALVVVSLGHARPPGRRLPRGQSVSNCVSVNPSAVFDEDVLCDFQDQGCRIHAGGGENVADAATEAEMEQLSSEDVDSQIAARSRVFSRPTMNNTRHAARIMGIAGGSSIAQTIVLRLAKDGHASFVTGQTTLIDGGEGHT